MVFESKLDGSVTPPVAINNEPLLGSNPGSGNRIISSFIPKLKGQFQTIIFLAASFNLAFHLPTNIPFTDSSHDQTSEIRFVCHK
ncbi:MAG: hypothetical protein IPO92_03775 [Saprospiraceae bacterium]|nr:hypothetical protein [Saprospiraceae bacterium]